MSRPAGASAASARPPLKGPAADDSDDDSTPAAKRNEPYRTDPKADALVQDAEKRMKSFSLWDKRTKYEDAVELLEKAASNYKMAKNWQEAGETYEKCANIIATKLSDELSVCIQWENAAKAYKNVNSAAALAAYSNAVAILMDNNKFAMAAKIWKEMGAINEKEHNTAEAIKTYEKAANCYESDNSTSNANAMWIKVADLSADAEDYKRAISVYEKVSKASLESSALRWGVKDYLFKALLCHLVIHSPSHNLDPVQSKLDSYVDLCPHLDNTREKGLIEELIGDFANDDSDAFADHVFRFDEIAPLDRWKSKVLLQVKKSLEGGNPEGNEVGV